MKRFLSILLLAFFATNNCFSQEKNSYNISLAIPLYLDQVNEMAFLTQNSQKILQQRPFSFVQFYEGFKIACDSIASTQNIDINLHVYDVTQDVATANTVVNDHFFRQSDLIIGPFHAKSFEIIENFAKENNIPIVNPVTNNTSLLNDNPLAIKVMPSEMSQLKTLTNLICKKYFNANIFVLNLKENLNLDIIRQIKTSLDTLVNTTAYVQNNAILDRHRRYVKNRKYHHLSYSNEEYSTGGVVYDVIKAKNAPNDSVAVSNSVYYYDFNQKSLDDMSNKLSSVRENVIILYGEDRVLATDALNKLNRFADNYSVTLITMPSGNKILGIHDDYLVKMKSIFFDKNFIDYDNYEVQMFIHKFRKEFIIEPSTYAFQGFDVAWYFIRALHLFGAEFPYNLADIDIDVLSTKYKFETINYFSGQENDYWNLYQFIDYQAVPVEQ